MNVSLILPPAERIAEQKDTPRYQHVGLGYLAAMLENKGQNVLVIDAKLQRLNFERTVNEVVSFSPDMVGITAMTHEIDMAGRLATRIKEMVPSAFVVIGGVHVTALPIQTLREYQAFDAGVMGEGEYVLIDIIERLKEKNFDFSNLKGVVYRKGRDILLSEPLERIENLDNIPFPAWHQFSLASEYIMITARGCPFSCIFCMQASGKKVRQRSAENVVDEIERVVTERPPVRFRFYDETFTLDETRVHRICDLIVRRGLHNRIRWSVTTRVDSINAELLLKMKSAGCDHIEFGVESGDQEILDQIKKNITLEQAEETVGCAKRLGFHTEGAFILGHPHETVKTAYKTLYFASKLNPDIVQLGIMVPYPGTEVARMASEGRGGYKIISSKWSDYNKQLGNALELETLSRSDLEVLQLVGYLKLFVYNKRFRDFIKFAWNYRREMFSFLRNHFNKKEKSRGSQFGVRTIARMVFSSVPEIKN